MLSLSLSLSLSLAPSLAPSLPLSLSICLSVYLSVYLSIYLSYFILLSLMLSFTHINITSYTRLPPIFLYLLLTFTAGQRLAPLSVGPAFQIFDFRRIRELVAILALHRDHVLIYSLVRSDHSKRQRILGTRSSCNDDIISC